MNHDSRKSFLSVCVREWVSFSSRMAVQSLSTQVGHLKASSELGVLCHTRRRAVPTNTPPNSSSRCPSTCGTPKKGHLAKFFEHVGLGLFAKDAISHTFQSHVECRETIAVLRQPVGRERRGWSHNISRTRWCTTGSSPLVSAP